MIDNQFEVLRVEIAKMALEPHEVLVVRFPNAISAQEASHTASAIKQVLPNTRVLISSDDVVFSVISQKVLCEECRAKI